MRLSPSARSARSQLGDGAAPGWASVLFIAFTGLENQTWFPTSVGWQVRVPASGTPIAACVWLDVAFIRWRDPAAQCNLRYIYDFGGYSLNIFATAPLTWSSSLFLSRAARLSCAMPRHTNFFAAKSSRSTTNSPLWMVTVVLPYIPIRAGPARLGSKGGMPPVAPYRGSFV